jgi:two-component system, cell cycle sensor histidine kinase and response regulator CckA
MTPLRLLLVEDTDTDAELVIRELERADFAVTFERVQTADQMSQALERGPWDLVLSDYRLPQFDGISAIELMKKKEPDVPVILVSGTMGEETAVNAMKAGARDYVMKDKLARLVPAVKRELQESVNRAKLRESEEQLRQSQKMESVGHLAGCIAHDFNNVLTIILMYCDSLLKEPIESEQTVKAIEQIRKSGTRAANLTRQLLAFSRKQALEPRVMNLNHTLSDFEKMLRRLIGERVELSLDLATDCWNIKADPGQIEQVIMNLAVNARDAMPGGGQLSLRTANQGPARTADWPPSLPAGPYVRLTVSDTGHGMAPEVQARIFDPFFTTKGPEKGTGLGLSTVYGIVKQSGGYIFLKSSPGNGAAFSIYFPKEEQPLLAGKAAAEPIPAVESRSATVVLVEDQEDVREIFVNALRKNGYEVLAPASGEEALSLLQEHREKISLLITDVVMPGISGPELAKRFAEACPGLGVILVSGYLADEMANYELVKERFLFMQKPFSLEQFLTKVSEGLKKSSK